ncbi:hypothetical protein ACYCFC_02120 [Stutzerimonas sp. NM35]
MRAHIIENGVITNTIEVESLDFMPGLVEATEGSIGDLYIDGQFVKPQPPAPNIPESVTMRQCRIALLDVGLLDAVKSSIATMPGTEGERARIDWEYAQEVRRDWPLIGYMAGDLGLTDEQVDGLFMAASAI